MGFNLNVVLNMSKKNPFVWRSQTSVNNVYRAEKTDKKLDVVLFALPPHGKKMLGPARDGAVLCGTGTREGSPCPYSKHERPL